MPVTAARGLSVRSAVPAGAFRITRRPRPCGESKSSSQGAAEREREGGDAIERQSSRKNEKKSVSLSLPLNLHEILLERGRGLVLGRDLRRGRHRVRAQQVVVAPGLLRRRRRRGRRLVLHFPRGGRGLPRADHLEVEGLFLSGKVGLRDLPPRLLDALDGVAVGPNVLLEAEGGRGVVAEANL